MATVVGTAMELTVKLGPRYDMPAALLPSEAAGWGLAATGQDYAIWSRPLDQ